MIIKKIKANPSASAILAITKSVSASGRNLKLTWDPSPKPTPKIPPEPTATIDCLICQPPE